MKLLSSSKNHLSPLVTGAVLGAILGFIVAAAANPLPLMSNARLIPASYRIPKIPGGTPLRLAMVHDVLHERYLRHGTAWYTRRNELARATIAAYEATATTRPAGPTTVPATTEPATPSTAYLDAIDDLAIGLESTGNYDESIALLRRKLAMLSPLPASANRDIRAERKKLQHAWEVEKDDLNRIMAAQNLSPRLHHQYTTCANLGTVLVHSAMSRALDGDAAAITTVREGLQYIENAIAMNPGAHFGRETWQAIVIEHLLACVSNPELRTHFDVIGSPIGDSAIQSTNARLRSFTGYGPDIIEIELTVERRANARDGIPLAGGDEKWNAVVHADYPNPMAFDEPTMAIIGMWTFGGGASPHFAMALGDIMASIGQLNIAWDSYERAIELSDKFWPDPADCKKMAALCRGMQQRIAAIRGGSDTRQWEDANRARHQKELAWGRQYQQEYQNYEATRIAAGAALSDPHFYDAFFKNHSSIASPPGLADDFILRRTAARSVGDFLPCMVLGAGLCMTLAVYHDRRRRNKSAPPALI